MKKLLILILALSTLGLQAQIILTRSNSTLNINDTYDVLSSDPMQMVTNIDPNPAGENVSWDLSSMNADFITGPTSVCVDPGTTLFSSEFADANLCIRDLEDEYGPYQYLKITDTKYELLGIGWHAAEGNSTAYYSPALTALEFPTSLGSTLSQNFTVNITTSEGVEMIDSSSVIIEADAWGTVITPAGSYDNVLRVKRATVSSTYLHMGENNWMAAGSGTIIDYEWFKPGIPVTVINVSEFVGDEGYTVAYLADHTHTGIDPVLAQTSEVFPNPCSDQITIINEGPALTSVRLYTLTGELVMAEALKSTRHELKTSSLKKGVYLLLLKSHESSCTKKVIIN